jgi:hypothetical protein
MTFVLEYDASANVWGGPRKAKASLVSSSARQRLAPNTLMLDVWYADGATPTPACPRGYENAKCACPNWRGNSCRWRWCTWTAPCAATMCRCPAPCSGEQPPWRRRLGSVSVIHLHATSVVSCTVDVHLGTLHAMCCGISLLDIGLFDTGLAAPPGLCSTPRCRASSSAASCACCRQSWAATCWTAAPASPPTAKLVSRIATK